MTSSSSLSSKNSIVHVVEQHDELDHLINPPVLSATKQQQQQQQREASSAITRSTNTNDSCCSSSSATTFMTSDDSTDGIISWDDIIIEKFLGIGGFNCVSLARIPKWDSIDNNNNKENVSHGHHQQQQQQQQKKKKKYAIKCLNKSVTIAATSSAISDKKKQKRSINVV